MKIFTTVLILGVAALAVAALPLENKSENENLELSQNLEPDLSVVDADFVNELVRDKRQYGEKTKKNKFLIRVLKWILIVWNVTSWYLLKKYLEDW